MYIVYIPVCVCIDIQPRMFVELPEKRVYQMLSGVHAGKNCNITWKHRYREHLTPLISFISHHNDFKTFQNLSNLPREKNVN